jgi:hypothetical protein
MVRALVGWAAWVWGMGAIDAIRVMIVAISRVWVSLFFVLFMYSTNII